MNNDNRGIMGFSWSHLGIRLAVMAFTAAIAVIGAPPEARANTLSLINVDTSQVIPGYAVLTDGVQINLAEIPTRRLTIRANPSVTVQSVVFYINGVRTNIENVPPYTLCRDTGAGYYDCRFVPGSYTLTVQGYSQPDGRGTQRYSQTIRFTVVDSAAPKVTRLALIDADRDMVIPGYESLDDGEVLNLALLPTRNLNVQAITDPPVVGSVRMEWDGRFAIQNIAPYALCNDTDGDYLPCPSEYFAVGVHTFAATAYSGASQTGVAGSRLAARVTVINMPPQPALAVTGFTLIDADTDLPVPGYETLADGTTLDLGALPRNLNIRVNTSPATVGSVSVVFDGVSSLQNIAPYAVCDDSEGDYYACPRFSLGSHTLQARAHSAANQGGSASQPRTIRFQVIESEPQTPPVGGRLAAVWANDGGDKVTRDERRASVDPNSVLNRVWDGTRVSLFGARNEVVNFNLVLEAVSEQTGNLSVTFDALTGPGGFQIRSSPVSGEGVFNWTQRQIELFYVRYLQIKGLSKLSYGTYDERHIPKRFQRPWTGEGFGSGQWSSRPDHDKFYPEIAVPMELQGTFRIAANQNQSVWADIYIPKAAPAGTYTGTVIVREDGDVVAEVPVQLEVKGFTLPDLPSSKTMIFLGYADLGRRYTGITYPNDNTPEAQKLLRVRDRHFLLAHRHKLSLIDSNEGPEVWSQVAPRPAWVPRLNGTLFTAANGYDGPGVGVGNNVFSIGTYGSWNWQGGGEAAMRTRTDQWEQWFRNNAPSTERFLYLIDESTNYAQTEQWASWVKNNPGVGGNLATFATLALPQAVSRVPSLTIPASWISVAPFELWNSASQAILNSPPKRFYMYNGKRPASGSFATEDDGVALRQLAWGQYKMNVARWFFWESTYYNNYQGGTGQTNVFQRAQTFGGFSGGGVTGETGWNYSNGDGVLFYPGTDTVYPAESYGLEGPIASLRLKHWRRGVQDVDYLTLAAQVDPTRVRQIVQSMVPLALWEYGVDDPNDPTWNRTDISWSINPDDWEAAREEFAAIIEGR